MVCGCQKNWIISYNNRPALCIHGWKPVDHCATSFFIRDLSISGLCHPYGGSWNNPLWTPRGGCTDVWLLVVDWKVGSADTWWQHWLKPSRVYAPSAPSMPWASPTRPSTQTTFVVYMTSRLLKHSILGLPVHLSPIPPYPHSKALEHLLVGNSGPSVISKPSASTAHNV